MRQAALRRHGILGALVLAAAASVGCGPAGAGDVGDLAPRLAPCAACHGKQGRSQNDVYYPSIAGKPAGYLYSQLQNFRAGRRRQAVMEPLLATLSDDYLREIAGYYAAQSPLWAPPAVGLPVSIRERGRQLAEHGDEALGVPACMACHGARLTGVEPSIPSLLGARQEYLSAQLGAWRNGVRHAQPPDCMAGIAARLDIEDIRAVTAWIASQSYPDDHRPARSLPARPPLDCGSISRAAAAEAARPAPETAPETAPEAAPEAPSASAGASAGAYLVRAGDCVGCHALPGETTLAGGRPIPTPFGDVFSTNLTPDAETGLGAWTADDFWRAMHEGRSKDGRLLYPAFPYPSFTLLTRADSDAIFAYLKSLAPVRRARVAPSLRFPYDTDLALSVWRMLYFRPARFEADESRSAQWNRGAYLVRGLGHCGTCHTPRDRLGGLEADEALAGARIQALDWDAPPLDAGHDGSPAAEAALARLLHAGVSATDAVAGPMGEVVFDSLQHLTAADIDAVVEYLAALPAAYRPEPPAVLAVPERERRREFAAGRLLYARLCADCHGDDGRGKPGAYPALAGNRLVTAPSAHNALRSVLFGGYPPSTTANPRPYGMPPFAEPLGDTEVAAVLTYIRGAWGNAAGAVSPAEVTRR